MSRLPSPNLRSAPSSRRWPTGICVGLLCGWSLIACGADPTDCGSIVEAGPRVQCRLSQLSPLATEPERLSIALAQIEDPTEHDLVALRMMVQTPSLFPLLCPQMRTDSARDRCQRLEARPHLSERARRPTAPTP